MRLKDLIYTIKKSEKEIYVFLEVTIDNKFYILSISDEQIRDGKCNDIINQAFPLVGVDKFDFRIENINHTDKIDIIAVKCQTSTFYPVAEHYLTRVSERTYNVEKSEECANKLAGCLFTMFNERQLEEFNSTWENMYTNWKRFGVKKI